MNIKKVFHILKLPLITFIIFLIPNLFWNKYFLYYVGGDDSLLYYLFPFEMVKNYLFNLVSDNVLSGLGSYGPQFYQAPFYLFIYVIKTIAPFLNTQLFFYGLNLSLGFLFFYLLLGIWIKNEKRYDCWLKVFASLFYTFSIFSFYTLLHSFFFSVYFISVFPLVLYLFLKGIYENKMVFIFIDSLILSLFSILLLAVPWVVALLLVILPLLIFSFWQNKKRFIIFFAVLAALVFLLNFYWLFHYLYSFNLSGAEVQGSPQNMNTVEFRQANAYLIGSVSCHNQIVYPIFNLFHKQLQIDYSRKSYLIYQNWHLKFLPFNLFFLIIIALAGFSFHKTPKNLRKLYTASLFAWLMALFFFTVNIDNWGIKTFLWLTNHVPWFVMFRNMFDKFGLAMAFSYAFLMCVSFKICIDLFKRDIWKIAIITTAIILTLVNAKPFILGEYYRSMPLWTTQNTFTSISDFNQDFYDLTDYLKKIDEPSRFLWLPLTSANYALIQDKNLSDHYYLGISPLQFLANKSDFAGKLSFGNEGEKLFENLIINKNYQEVGAFFQKMNVKYIIVNNSISSDLATSYLLSWHTPGDAFQAQQEQFQSVILGDKIRNFGSRYSLYTLNKQFANEKLYLTSDLKKIPTDFSQVQYKKLASYEYRLTVKNLKESSYLVFLDPYQKLWKLSFVNDRRLLAAGFHETVFDYANGWKLNPAIIKASFPKEYYSENPDGSINLDLTLYFRPQSYFYLVSGVSSITFLCCLIYLGYFGRSKKKSAINAA